MKNEPHIIVNGNPVDGFTFIGPFPSKFDAMEYANVADNLDDASWWIAILNDPV